MGKVIMSGIVPQLSVPCLYNPVFENNTWEQIIEACQNNAVPETWVVGDQKAMTINGTDYMIDIIGTNHDIYSDGSGTAPLTFQMHDCYNTHYAIYTPGMSVKWSQWDMSTLRTDYLNTIFAMMPNEVQIAIKEVDKVYYALNLRSLSTTQDKLFVLAEVEVIGNVSLSYGEEGSQYEYYTAGNSKIKKYNGSNDYWWLRSNSVLSSNCFCAISDSGECVDQSHYNEIGISFAFFF